MRVAEPALGDPDVRQRDRAPEDVGRRARPAATVARHRRTPRAPPRDRRCAQDASPIRAEAAPRPRSSSVVDEVERQLGVRDGAGERHPGPAPARRGRRRRRPEGGGAPPRRRRPSRLRAAAVARRRHRRVEPALGVLQPALDPVELVPVASSAPTYADAEHRPDPDHVVGQRSSQPRSVASCRSLRSAGTASSTRSAARSKSIVRPSRAGWPRPARRSRRTRRSPAGAARHDVRRLARPAGPAARRRRGGGSGTTGAGRRAGPGTGCPAPAPRAWPCRRAWPVTASHSGPLSRSRMEVCSRKPRTSSGWRCRTSSTR